MVVKQCVDWLSYTAKDRAYNLREGMIGSELYPRLNALSGHDAMWQPCIPRNGYTSAYQAVDKPGLTVMWNDDRNEMGAHVNWSGSALTGMNYEKLSEKIFNYADSIGRIDLAIDIDEAWDISIAYESFMDKTANTSARQCNLIQGTRGQTVYVGSRASQKYLRIYDKAAQTGTPEPWTRVELECKGEFAYGVFMFLFNNRDVDMRDVIKGFCDFPEWQPWLMAMASPTPPWTNPQVEKSSNTRRWLLEGVAPTLANLIVTDADFRQTWHDRMYALLHGRVGEADPFDNKGDFELD